MNQRKNISVAERLNSVLYHPKPERAAHHLYKSIEFLSSKDYSKFQQTRIIEFFLIAKFQPRSFADHSVQDITTKISNFHQGLATGLFMAMGYAINTNGDLMPPCMAHLLYQDIIGDQEFCFFEPAQKYIKMIILLYFTPFDRIAPKFRERMENTKRKYEAELPGGKYIKRIITDIEERTKLLPDQINSIALDLMHFFLPLKSCIIKFYQVLNIVIKNFPSFVPKFFAAVKLYLISCNTSEKFNEDFIQEFFILQCPGYQNEYNNVVNEILLECPDIRQQSMLIAGVKVDDIACGFFWLDNEKYKIFRNRIIENLSTKISSLHAYSILLSFVNLSKTKKHPEGINLNDRILDAYAILTEGTNYSMINLELMKNSAMSVEIVVSFLVQNNTNKDLVSQGLEMLKQYLVPGPLLEVGMMTTEIVIKDLLNAIFMGSVPAMDMICRVLYFAAKAQSSFMVSTLLQSSDSDALDNISSNISTLNNHAQLRPISLTIAAHILICSPDRVGAVTWARIIHDDPSLKQLMAQFVLESLSDHDEMFVDITTRHKRDKPDESHLYEFIIQFARVKGISGIYALHFPQISLEVLRITNPYPPQKWFAALDIFTSNNIELFFLICLLRLTLFASQTDDYTDAHSLFTQELLRPMIDQSRKINASPTEKDAMIIRYIGLLAHPEQCVRVAAFTAVTLVYLDATGKPQFKLPVHPDAYAAVGEAIIHELDEVIVREYNRFIMSNSLGAKAVRDFERACPILFHTLNGQGALVANVVIPDMGVPSFGHTPISGSKFEAETSLMPNFEDPPQLISEMVFEELPDPNLSFNFTPSENIELAKCDVVDKVYRCVAVLETARHNDPTRFYALAYLKRLIKKEPIAFESALLPLLPAAKSSLSGTHPKWDILASLFSICLLRRNKNNDYTTEELRMIGDDLMPLIHEMDLSDNADVEALKKALLGDMKAVRKRTLPLDFSLNSFNMSIADQYQFTLIASSPEQNEERLLRFGMDTTVDLLSLQDDVLNSVVIPLILSSPAVTINNFFKLIGNCQTAEYLKNKILKLMVVLRKDWN